VPLGLDSTVLILALVVVVIGGSGSVRGALVRRVDHRSDRVAGPGPAARPRLVHPVRALALVLVFGRALFGGPAAVPKVTAS